MNYFEKQIEKWTELNNDYELFNELMNGIPLERDYNYKGWFSDVKALYEKYVGKIGHSLTDEDTMRMMAYGLTDWFRFKSKAYKVKNKNKNK